MTLKYILYQGAFTYSHWDSSIENVLKSFCLYGNLYIILNDIKMYASCVELKKSNEMAMRKCDFKFKVL